MVIDKKIYTRRRGQLKDQPAWLLFIFFFLNFLIAQNANSGENFNKEFRESIVTTSSPEEQVYTFSVKVKGVLDLNYEQRGYGSSWRRPFDSRYCRVKITLNTLSTSPCLVDHRSIEDLPLKNTPSFSCIEKYNQISSREVFNADLPENCGASMSQITGTYESFYGNPDILQEIKANTLGPFYNFLNDNQENFSKLNFLKNKTEDNDLKCAQIPLALRSYCQESGNCSVNVWKKECVRIFNKEGMVFLGGVYPSENKSMSEGSFPFVYSAAINPGSGNYSGPVITIPSSGSSGSDRIDRLNRMATDYDRRTREFAIAELHARRRLYEESSAVLNIKRAAFQEQQDKFRKIGNEYIQRLNDDDFKLEASPSDPDYRTLYFAEEKRVDAEKIVLAKSRDATDREERQKVLDFARFQNHLADTQVTYGDKGLGWELIKANLLLSDIALDFTPAGPVKNTLSFITGYSMTGEKLTPVERGITLGSVFLPGLLKGGALAFAKLAQVLKAASLEVGTFKYLPVMIGIIKESDKELKYLAKAEGNPELGRLTSELLDSAHKVGAKDAGAILELEEMVAKYAQNNPGKVYDVENFISGKLIRYNPLHHGPLHEISERIGTVAETFRGSSYFGTKLEEPIKLYRVYSEESRQLNRYWSRIKPAGPLQAIVDSALDPLWGNQATRWVEITVPANETIYEGFVSNIALSKFTPPKKIGELLGGGSQVYINLEDIPSWWITNRGTF